VDGRDKAGHDEARFQAISKSLKMLDVFSVSLRA
jgi:hypothetical protein